LALSKIVRKEDFRKMEFIGQFNKGFLLTKLGSSLFIIDQHAADEKYKYEELWKTNLSSQKLMEPIAFADVTDELLALDRPEVFEKHGFKVDIDENRPVGRRALITAVPVAKGHVFGQSDARDLVSMLQDDLDAMPRLPKLHKIFASKACRTSVMIGTALDEPKVRPILDHMSTMDQPWNCPHGRPTMRHLAQISDLANIIQDQLNIREATTTPAPAQNNIEEDEDDDDDEEDDNDDNDKEDAPAPRRRQRPQLQDMEDEDDEDEARGETEEEGVPVARASTRSAAQAARDAIQRAAGASSDNNEDNDLFDDDDDDALL